MVLLMVLSPCPPTRNLSVSSKSIAIGSVMMIRGCCTPLNHLGNKTFAGLWRSVTSQQKVQAFIHLYVKLVPKIAIEWVISLPIRNLHRVRGLVDIKCAVPLRQKRFIEEISSLCRKVGNKLSVLARLSNFMSFKQRRILSKTFIESRFGYCPLIWMFHSRRVNNKTNNLHERSLRVVYKTITDLKWTCFQRTNGLPFIKETLSLLLENYF